MRSHDDHGRRDADRGRGAGAPARRRAAAGLIAVALLAAGPAVAQTATTVTVEDEADVTVDGALDLESVSFGKAKDGRLRATITLLDAFTGEDLAARSGAAPASICLKMWTKTTPPDEVADHLACVTATAEGGLRASILEDRPNQLPKRVGTAALTRASQRSVTLRFSQKLVDKPARILFQAEATKAGCPRTSCIDVAPDGVATRTLRLRSGT